MPICEADPWRMQYFQDVVCPPDVRIPTEDFDAYEWNPAHHWVYNKLLVAESQGILCAPHGVTPRSYPVFSKPHHQSARHGRGQPRAGEPRRLPAQRERRPFLDDAPEAART
jgi:hypothetical protein